MSLRRNRFLAYLLLVCAAASFRLQITGADDDDWPFVEVEGFKGYQVVFLENLSSRGFYVECKGYHNHDLKRPFHIGSGYVRSNARFTMEFDRVKSWHLFEVFCTYYGAVDDCSAEMVSVFFAPGGDDLYYCSRESLLMRGCGYRFKADGSVFKVGGGDREQYIAQVPTKNNYKKLCIGNWCFRPFWRDPVIGDVQCCNNKCN